jgi:hypothetical protein
VSKQVKRGLVVGLLAVAIAGCAGDPGDPGSTGLTGTVLRGPVQPVCSVNEPCTDEPFSASFAVYRGTRRSGQFHSDSFGAFTIALAPGKYRIVPGPDAPLLNPTAQAKDVEVGTTGTTSVQLVFDTGIR